MDLKEHCIRLECKATYTNGPDEIELDDNFPCHALVTEMCGRESELEVW